MKIIRTAEGQSITIIGDLHTNEKCPVIYACTHIGYFDIMILFEAIKKPCWLFWGNPLEELTSIYGWMARKNGTVLVDAYDKDDRKLAKREAEMLLNQGGSLMIFPEGAWNITDNEPVMKLFQGTVSMAMNTGAVIIPVALEQYGKEFFVNIGSNISIPKDDINIEMYNRDLRDTLATLKWQIWERMPVIKRTDISDTYRATFVANILKDGEGKYTEQMIENERFHDKETVEKDEVFAFLKDINYKRENAFLLRKS